MVTEKVICLKLAIMKVKETKFMKLVEHFLSVKIRFKQIYVLQ